MVEYREDYETYRMKIISILAIIILPLVGYSAGTAVRASKARDLKPGGADLVLMAMIWAGAALSRGVWTLHRWLLVLAWVLLAALFGYLAGALRKQKEPSKKRGPEAEKVRPGGWRGIWDRWKDFSRRMGGFQSRIILSFFYFIVVTPFALASRIFSDPLRLKYRSIESFWLPKPEGQTDIEDSRRQF